MTLTLTTGVASSLSESHFDDIDVEGKGEGCLRSVWKGGNELGGEKRDERFARSHWSLLCLLCQVSMQLTLLLCPKAPDLGRLDEIDFFLTQARVMSSHTSEENFFSISPAAGKAASSHRLSGTQLGSRLPSAASGTYARRRAR